MSMLIIAITVLSTSVAVLVDASHIGARRGLLPGTLDMGPAGWFFACLGLWIVAFPCYLAARPRIIKAQRPAPVARPRTARGAVGVWVARCSRCDGLIALPAAPDGPVVDCPHCGELSEVTA